MDDIDVVVKANFDAIMKDAGTFFTGTFQRECLKVADSEQRVSKKYHRLVELVERAGQYIAPHTACREGCHHCCHMAVTITGYEAAIIGKHIGRQPTPVNFNVEHFIDAGVEVAQAELRDKYTGKDCPFLKDSKCSIYEVRPLACRSYFNISGEPDLCDLTKGANDVPSIDFRVFWAAQAAAFMQYEFGDLRDFFPFVKGGVIIDQPTSPNETDHENEGKLSSRTRFQRSSVQNL